MLKWVKSSFTEITSYPTSHYDFVLSNGPHQHNTFVSSWVWLSEFLNYNLYCNIHAQGKASTSARRAPTSIKAVSIEAEGIQQLLFLQCHLSVARAEQQLQEFLGENTSDGKSFLSPDPVSFPLLFAPISPQEPAEKKVKHQAKMERYLHNIKVNSE